jgi:Acetyltransferases, including N-acetylases of ribosomal proteins
VTRQPYAGIICLTILVIKGIMIGKRDVNAVEAETDPGNIASQRVLEKCGFHPMGIMGEEGPRYIAYEEKSG